jgi:hypothetical protein
MTSRSEPTTGRTVVGGAQAGAVAALLWAAQQPFDKRLFRSTYDDVELLGKLVTRGSGWLPVGLLLHVSNGAIFGTTFALLRLALPGPPVAQALGAAMAEHFGFWPLGRLSDRFHPARRDMPKLTGNRRAFAQALWRHALFGITLGLLEPRLNRRSAPALGRP